MNGSKMSSEGCCPPWWLFFCVLILLAFYSLFDLAYFCRMTYTILKARYCKSKICVLEKVEIKSWCFLNDIDTLLYHMNNARYLRELDFARADFYERTALWASIRRAGGAVVQGSTTVRYRRYLKPGATFTITSQAVYWDDKTIFMDHEFVSPDGFVNAVATCRQRVIGCEASAVVTLLHQVHCGGLCKAMVPTEIPPEIAAWVESNDISSAKLRKNVCKICDPERCQCNTQLPPRVGINTEKPNGHVEMHVWRVCVRECHQKLIECIVSDSEELSAMFHLSRIFQSVYRGSLRDSKSFIGFTIA